MGSYLMNESIFAQSLFFFSFLYIGSIIMTMSCSDWFLIWVGLEINMMSFISLIYNRSADSVEVCLKYFFIQSLGSGILMMMFYYEFELFNYVSLSVLSYKIGGGPFYFWFPNMCESISWGSCFILMTIQKILPLLIMSFLISMFLWTIIIISVFVGAMGSLNQKKIKRLLAYSSIHHIGWIMVLFFGQENIWLLYLMLYMFMIMGIIKLLHQDKILDMGALGNLSSKFNFIMGMLSMGGMPPMLGFFMKWLVFFNILLLDYSIMLMLIVMSVLMFYVYFRIVYELLMESKILMSWKIGFSKSKILSIDSFYLFGMNLGMMGWFLI